MVENARPCEAKYEADVVEKNSPMRAEVMRPFELVLRNEDASPERTRLVVVAFVVVLFVIVSEPIVEEAVMMSPRVVVGARYPLP